MPVYEYECKQCNKIFEVQQKISDEPMHNCPECQAPVKKLLSLSSFQLKGGGWYADGYSSAGGGKKNDAPNPAPSCQAGGGCASCPAAAASNA
jgi:putative FmdB family regulatory protein